MQYKLNACSALIIIHFPRVAESFAGESDFERAIQASDSPLISLTLLPFAGLARPWAHETKRLALRRFAVEVRLLCGGTLPASHHASRSRPPGLPTTSARPCECRGISGNALWR